MDIAIKFYSDKTGCFKKGLNVKWNNQAWQKYQELTPEEIETIWDAIFKKPKVKRALLHLSKFFPGNKKEILNVFINCNWTNLKNEADITNNKLLFQNVKCPHKYTGHCPYNGKGIVCIKHK